MYLGENNGNLSETKKCYLFPTLPQNEKIFCLIWEKVFSWWVIFISLRFSASQTVLLQWQVKKYSKRAIMCSFWVFFLKMRIRNLQGIYYRVSNIIYTAIKIDKQKNVNKSNGLGKYWNINLKRSRRFLYLLNQPNHI